MWDGGAGTANWSDANNWDTNLAPANGEGGNIVVVLPLNINTTQNIAGLVIGDIKFQNSGSATLTLATPLGLSHDLSQLSIEHSSGTNTITGGSLTLSAGCSTPTPSGCPSPAGR